MHHQFSLYKVASTVDNAMTGAGAGAIVGLLTTLFREKPTIKDAVKHTLIGGGAGAVAGVGVGAIKGAEPEPPVSKAPVSKPGLNPISAALTGALPVAGPAIYGAMNSAPGEGMANALKLGGSSWAGLAPGAVAFQSTANPKLKALSAIMASLGSGAGSGLMANHINKSGAFDLKGIASNIGQQYDSAKGGIGNIQINPLDPMSGATAGGVGGAALGGGIGLIKSLLDSEDDGILGALRKALQGAAVGGVGGAALGGGYSMMRRNNLLNELPNQDPKQRGAVSEIMSKYTVPLKSEVNRMTGGNPRAYDGEIGSINRRSSISHLVSPALVSTLEGKANA